MNHATFNQQWQAFKDALQDPDIDYCDVMFSARVFLEWYDGLRTWDGAVIVRVAGWILDAREAVR